ncbi:hypothetical protein [uncultured Dokdonia sp.]|uniref:hypothetical protein n=1 Tax=uncultured Dokdonia sp. TaxID=575653 RepID=UPI002623FAB4|nr:hypothetical protein [uncultured Dokdonia sp.]
MILKEFYLDKKERIETEMSFSGFIPNITFYNDKVLKHQVEIPTLLFKYVSVDWKNFSEEVRIATVDFCIYILLPIEALGANENQYESVFDFSKSIDKAILSGNEKIGGVNTTFKMKEKQYSYPTEACLKNTNHFIWELSYKTALRETNTKNTYGLLCAEAALENQNHTPVESFSGPFISLEDQKIYDIIKTPFNNN